MSAPAARFLCGELTETVRRVVGFTGEIVWDDEQAGWHAAQANGQLAPVCIGLATAG